MSSAARTASSPYSVHPGVAQTQKWIRDLPEKTGLSLDEWLELTRKSRARTEQERRDWLKK